VTVMQRVWSYTNDRWIRCNWFECDRDGFEQYKAIQHDHHPDIRCGNIPTEHTNYIFCSERHLRYYQNSVKDLWNLPAGMRH
jgi:hypothetical protein